MSDFHEVRFPTSISRGSSGGPRRRTDIVTLRSGYEERNAVWADSRREYDAGLGVRSLNDLHKVLEFFEARRGRLYGFRWKDWADYKSVAPNSNISATDQTIMALPGETTVFQLSKTYSSGPVAYTRKITKPVSGTVSVTERGVLLVDGIDFLVDYNTGLVYFGYAPSGVVTAGFEFDVPVRFTNDHIDITVDLFNAGQVPQINVIEVKTGPNVRDHRMDELALWNWLQVVDINTSVNINWGNIWGTL